MPSANLSFMIDFLQDNEFSIVSSMRPRPPSQIITYLEISESLPPYTAPTTPSYATLDHILCRSFVPYVLFPMSHYPGSIAISSPRTYSYHIFSLPNLTHLRRGGASLPQTPSSNITNLPCQPSASPLPFSINHLHSSSKQMDHIRTCPDQFHISPQNPADWGVYFESTFLDLYGPVGSLPFQVTGSNNTAELQAPLEGIAFMLQHPPLPPHIIFPSRFTICP